jgi:dTMP kinase
MDARKAERSLTAMEAATLQASDLQHRVDTEIVPQLNRGKIVLVDRYVFAGVARDVARGFQRDWSLRLYAPFQLPDMVFYFSVSAQTCAKRIAAVREMDYYDAGQDVTGISDPVESYQRFAAKMIGEYVRLSQQFAFIVINAERPIEEQQRFIQEAFEQKVASFRPDHVAYWDPPSLNQAQPSL